MPSRHHLLFSKFAGSLDRAGIRSGRRNRPRGLGRSTSMGHISLNLAAVERGDPNAVAELLQLVHHELRRLAAMHMAHEAPGHTLQATALVSEVYLRLFGENKPQRWDGRGHFFAAASEAMRRILVDNARQKKRIKRGGGKKRVDLDEQMIAIESPSDDDILALDEALELLVPVDAKAARLVEL